MTAGVQIMGASRDRALLARAVVTDSLEARASVTVAG
jgi:hypothetical protein